MRSLKTAAIAAIAGFASLAFAGIADAEKIKAESTVLMPVTFELAFGNVYFAGNVESTKKKCISGRTIEARFSYSDRPTEVVDVAVTGLNGGWGVVLTPDQILNAEAADFTALKEKIKLSKKKTLICGEDEAFIV